MKSDGYWRPSNIEMLWQEWLLPLKYSEPVLIVSYPGSDLERRLIQLTESEFGVNQKWIIKNYLVDKWSDLGLPDNAENIILVIIGFEKIIKEGRSDLILQIRDVYRNTHCKVILLSGSNFYDVSTETVIQNLPTFEPRIRYHTLYNRVEVVEFIKYLGDKWNMVIGNELSNLIVDEVGVHLRFVKPIIWYLRDNGMDKLREALESLEMVWRAKTWWSQFSDSDRECLKHVAFGLPVSGLQLMSLKYLESTKVIENGSISSKFFCNFIKKYAKNPKLLHLEGDRLVVHGEDYSSNFISSHRAILCKLLSSPGKIVTRGELMDLINVDTDWALDSHLSRLRAKMEIVGIGKSHLVTRRGVGVLWRS